MKQELKDQCLEHFYFCIKQNRPHPLLTQLMLVLEILSIILLFCCFVFQKEIFKENETLLHITRIISFGMLTLVGLMFVYYVLKIDKFVQQIEYWSFYNGYQKTIWQIFYLLSPLPVLVGGSGLIFFLLK